MEDLILIIGQFIYRKPSGISPNHQGNIKWIKISKLFKGRKTDVQCRERFVNILDPSIKSTKVSKKEIVEIVRLYMKYGAKWSKISSIIRFRTDCQCKRLVERLEKSGQFSKYVKMVKKEEG